MPALPISVNNTDTAGGVIGTPQQTFFKVEGQPVALNGELVASHPPPVPPVHLAASMIATATSFKVNGMPVVRAGDLASCGHVATGRPWFRVS